MAMKGGRKNLKRAVNDETLTLQDGQSIMQVVSLRGNNQIQVIDPKGETTLAIFPAKFQKTMWIKRASFVVVDDSGREEALESRSKVACVVVQLLFHHQVRVLQKTPQWPEVFKSTVVDTSSNGNNQMPPLTTAENEESDSSEDDGLPPLEANTNRRIHTVLQYDTESDSDTQEY